MRPLIRFRTYLSPSLPLGLFEAVAATIGDRLGCRVEVQTETRWSGPRADHADPFATGDIDVAFVCAPSYLSLVRREAVAAELVPLAPVFDDPRAAGRPVYFSDLVVRRDCEARDLRDLRGATWSYNDRCSLSGYWGMLKALHAAQLPAGHFGRSVQAGTHLASAAAVAAGAADVAAIDSNVLRLLARTSPDLTAGLRRLRAIGPQPIQPVVVRRSLDAPVREGIAAVLRGAWRDLRFRRALARYGVDGFAPVSHAHYAAEARMLDACRALAA